MVAPALAVDLGLRVSRCRLRAPVTVRYDQPPVEVGDCSADARADAARAAGGGLSPVVGSGSRAKDAHKRGDDESLDLLLRFTSDFEPHKCQDHPIE